MTVLMDPIAVAVAMIRDMFDAVGEGEVHGLAHSLCVEHHARQAIGEYVCSQRLHADEQMAVRLAALLHDVDDDKIFPGNGDELPNARRVLKAIDFSLTSTVLTMIRMVSFSKNGNSGALFDLVGCRGRRSTPKGILPRWMYIPRDADRIEALGDVGVARCIAYGYQVGRPLMAGPLPCRDVAQLYALAARWHLTGHRCRSSMEYFVAGLIPRTVCATGLEYFKREFSERAGVVFHVCKLACEHPQLDVETVRAQIHSTEARKILDDHRMMDPMMSTQSK